MLQIQRRSGLSVVAFCRRVGIKQHRLYAERREAVPPDSFVSSFGKGIACESEQTAAGVRSTAHLAAGFESTMGSVCAELSHPSGVRLHFPAQIP